MSNLTKPFIHKFALVEEGAKIGAGTRIWAFAHVLTGSTVGDNCNICDHTYIESGVTVGNNVTLKCGVYLWAGIEVGDDVFIGPNATFTNDKNPRSGNRDFSLLKTHIEKNASIGANATILPGVRIGAGSVVGAGAVVTRDVEPGTTVVGNPARKIKTPA